MLAKPMRILYVFEERIPEELRQLVIDSFPRTEFVLDTMTYSEPEKQQCAKMRWADAVLFAPGRHLSEAVFESASHVRLMQLWSSGYDKFNTAAARKYGIPVANNGGANAISVAEHTLLLMLSVNKRLPDSHARTVQGRWAGNSHGTDMFLLQDKTLGIVGFGNIGRAVAQRAAAFQMRILYSDPHRAPEQVERQVAARRCSLDELLSSSDIVSLHVHLNASTEGMIGQRELDLMKRSALLINVSRAQLVETEALTESLRTGNIRGAGLDVYDDEPTRPGDPLLQHPYVVATPHMAGSTYDAYVAALTNCVQNFCRVRDGLEPLWVVNEEHEHALA
ncbi:MAG: 2-hydroxyacid dehydrogenase [Planctomycetota bacterium]